MSNDQIPEHLKNVLPFKTILENQEQFIKSFHPSTFATRCLELIERGNNTFANGWKDAINELVEAGKIEIVSHNGIKFIIKKIG